MFEILTSIVETIFKILFELLSMLFGGSEKKGYHAKFASESILLSRWNKGFCLTGSKQITRKDSYLNALIVGGTGSGKTQSTLLPTIYISRSSLIINDVSGELFEKSSGIKQMQGYDIRVMHFSNPEISSAFNPMDFCDSDHKIQKLASMLARSSNPNSKSDPFWETQAAALLSVLISIVKLTQPPHLQNLSVVNQLLNLIGEPVEEGEENQLDRLFVRYADAKLYKSYKSFISYESKLLMSIVASSKAALNIFSDEAVARVTSANTINFEDFRKRPTALYIMTSVSDQKYYAPISAIFYEMLCGYLLSRFPKEDELDVHLLLDEFAALGRVPVMPSAFANLRKHRASIFAVVQDFSQVIGAYGKDDGTAIRSNAFSKIFFGGGSPESTREISEVLGKFTHEKDGKKDVLPLLTADQVRMLKSNRSILICGHHPPILARMCPAYKSFRFKQFLNIPPVTLIGDCPATAPVLPF